MSSEIVTVIVPRSVLFVSIPAPLTLKYVESLGVEVELNLMKALEWCMDHQYFGEDSVARGGIVGRSWPSGITFRHWFDVIVTYTVSFFGNSLAEALSLDEWKE